MPQDRTSGTRASNYGLECGKRIIRAIGAKATRSGSNECILNNELVTVHCARKNTRSIGVTYKSLENVIAVLGAFEQKDSSYIVWRMSKKRYQELMTETKSRGSSHGRVGIVTRADIELHGSRFAVVRTPRDGDYQEVCERKARIRKILADVKILATEYYQLTGKPLGVTGEIAESVAADALGLELVQARTVGFDALRGTERIQIKGRAYGDDAKPGQRISRIKMDAPCDAVLLVLLDNKNFELKEIWEAPMESVRERLAKAGSKSRERGALGVSEFQRLRSVRQIWPTATSK